MRDGAGKWGAGTLPGPEQVLTHRRAGLQLLGSGHPGPREQMSTAYKAGQPFILCPGFPVLSTVVPHLGRKILLLSQTCVFPLELLEEREPL